MSEPTTARPIGRSQWTDVAQIPDVLERTDVTALLGIGTSGFYHLKEKAEAAGKVFVPELEPRIGRPRYNGAWIRQWLRGELDERGKKLVEPRKFFPRASGVSR